MSVPRKGDIIINPKTQRPIKVGGRTWLKLVRENLIEGRYTDPKELTPIQEDVDINEQITQANQNLPRGVQAVRGRGRYKGKIVKRNKRPNVEDMSRYTAEIASRAIKENYDELNETDDVEAELQRLIMSEMSVKKKGRGRPRKKKEVKQMYVTEEPQMYDEEEYIDNDYLYDNDDNDDDDNNDDYDDEEDDVNDYFEEY